MISFKSGAVLAVSSAALGLLLAACGGGAGTSLPAGVGRAPASSSLNSAAAWSVYNYNPADTNITPTPADYANGTATFHFQKGVYTARLTTDANALTGDLSAKTLHAALAISGATGTFVDHLGGGCGNPPAVRFFFITQGQGGFAYTNYWWSNPVSWTLTNGAATLTQKVNDPATWSDFNGKRGSNDPATTAAFEAAIANVQTVGLSFGEDCFFENGTTTSDGSGTFSSTFTES